MVCVGKTKALPTWISVVVKLHVKQTTEEKNKKVPIYKGFES